MDGESHCMSAISLTLAIPLTKNVFFSLASTVHWHHVSKQSHCQLLQENHHFQWPTLSINHSMIWITLFWSAPPTHSLGLNPIKWISLTPNQIANILAPIVLSDHSISTEILTNNWLLLEQESFPPDTSSLHMNPNINLKIFNHLFGIENNSNSVSHIQYISQYEYVWGFGFDQNMTFELSKPTLLPALKPGIPANTSFWLFSSIHHALNTMRKANTEIIDHNHPPAAPAVTLQAFVSGAFGTRLRDYSSWCHAYQLDL